MVAHGGEEEDGAGAVAGDVTRFVGDFHHEDGVAGLVTLEQRGAGSV
jgi:hypothetical protein